MELNANGGGLSSGHRALPLVKPVDGLVELRHFHLFAGCSEQSVRLWVKDGMPVIKHRMKHHEVRIARWLEFMERYDKGLPPKDPPGDRNRKKKEP